MRRFAHAAAAALALAAACHTPDPDTTEVDLVVPDAWDGAATAEPVAETTWWNTLGEPALDPLVREALENNRDLRASLARVEAAGAQARVAKADLFPILDANGSIGRSKQIFTGLPAVGGDVIDNTTDSYGVSLDVSWEVDLWGRLAARRDAAAQDLEATAADHAAAQHSVAAQTVKGWFAWQEARLQKELAEETVATFQRSSDIARRRYQTGRGESLDVHRADSTLAGAQALYEARSESVERTARQLEILLGRYPAGDLDGEAFLPGAGDVPATGLPGELLERRPDLLAARARLRAANLRLYEARKNLLPRLTLSGSVGRTSTDIDDLSNGDFDTWSWLAGLTQPIFQGGRLRAGVDLTDARVREAVELYAQALLVAFREVETLLAIEEQLRRRLEYLETASAEAQTAKELASDRYGTGLVDLTTLLDAQRFSLEADRELLDARFQRLEARVDLFLALGGGFE